MISVEEINRRKVAKVKCEHSLLFFTRYLYKARHGRKYIVNDHHRIICEALEGVLLGKITRLIINIAPRYGKTELAVKNFIAHGLALNPGAKFIHLTYAAKLALDNSEEAKDIVQSERYQELFNVQIKKDSKAKDKWYTDVGGGVYAAAAGGQVTGFGAGKVDEEGTEAPIDDEALNEFVTEIEQKEGFGGAIIIDDPIKPEDGASEIKRRRVNERFETTIRNRVNSRKTPIIVIQQRVHENDLSGYLMEQEPGEWTVIKLPCLKPNGDPLWEMKHTADELRKLQRINAYVFESQYQQDPKPMKKGGEFYKLFSMRANVIPNGKNGRYPRLYSPEIAIHQTFDFNVNPHMTDCIWQIYGADALKRYKDKEMDINKDILVYLLQGYKVAVQIDEICPVSPKNSSKATCIEFHKKYPNHDAGMFVYGDPSGKKEDTRSEKGQNDYTIILRELSKYRPSLHVDDSAPAVVMRGNWINAVFAENVSNLVFLIGDNCAHTLKDYQFLKEDSDGTKLKEKAKDPVTEVTYEKYGHPSDANDYFFCRAFKKEYTLYQKGGLSTKAPTLGKSNSKNIY